MNTLEIVEVDLSDNKHADAVLAVTNRYAQDPMGRGANLPESTRRILVKELQNFPLYIGFIAFVDGKPAGLANCFYTFSTFKAAHVINIHDLAVMPDYRSMGIGQALIGAVVKKAKEKNCCKVTLEVREDNRARNLYEREGFSYGKPMMYFMTKELS